MLTKLVPTPTILLSFICLLVMTLGVLALVTRRGSGVPLLVSSYLLLLTVWAAGADSIPLVATLLVLLLAVASREPPEDPALEVHPFPDLPPEVLEKFPGAHGPADPGIFRPSETVTPPPRVQPPG
jgi:hypothetical protein